MSASVNACPMGHRGFCRFWTLILLPVLLLGGCASPGRTLPPKSLAPAPACTAATAVGELIGHNGLAEQQLSGITLLDTGREAFAVRAALIEAASCSIDLQYYIWNSDASGRYLASRLLVAAMRGVRVRILLDDINIGGREDVLVELAAHPNVEIQVYNPFHHRSGLRKAFNLIFEFGRLNRRMHVKSFTVDQAVTILGGRNIGDEYFDLHSEFNFRDRDVMASGPAVADTMTMFAEFWNWALARPVAELAAPERLPSVPEDGAWLLAAAQRIDALHGPLPRDPVTAIEDLRNVFEAEIQAPARLVYDPPPAPDALGETDQAQSGSRALRDIARDTRAEMLIESAYLVLDDEMLNTARTMHARGVRIRALTNSLASNDVTGNHAAYARRRKSMLESGVELYELRPDAASCTAIVENTAACTTPHAFGLHAKTYVIDRRGVYVGSLNLNLRSRYLNAESGLIIESTTLAERVARDIEINMDPANSWRPVLDEHDRLRWIEGGDGTPQTLYTREPRVGWLRRMQSALIAMLPAEKYL